MKFQKTNRFNPSLATLASCAALMCHFAAPSASAGVLYWDGSDTVTSGAQGGAGTWDSNTTPNWWDGSADVVWPNSGTDNDGVFGGTAGTVTVSSVTANDLLFNTTGYILSGASTLTLNGTTPTITTGSGISATIGNNTATVLAGSDGLTKAGLGTLTLNGSAVNIFTGGVTIKGGTLALNLGNLAAPTNLVDSTNSLTIGGGTLAVTGKSSGVTSQTLAGTSVTSGNSSISFNRNGGTTGTLNLGTVTHAVGGTVSFSTNTTIGAVASTSEMIKVSNAASSTNGGLAAWAFANSSATNAGRWAAVDASGTIRNALSNTVIGTNWSSVTSAVSIYTTSAAVTLAANATAQGLQNAVAANSTVAVALGTRTLTVNGLLSINSGVNWNFTSSGAGGITIGSEKELILAGAGNFGLGAPISNNGGGASGLTHAGGGTVTFTGVNAYTGQTTVNSGKMIVSTGGAINTSSGIVLNGGTFVQSNTATAISPAVTLQGGTLDGTGTINTVNVSDLVTNKITNGNGTTTALTIGSLTLNGDATIDIRTAGSAGLAVSGTLTTTPANGTVIVNVTSAPTWTTGSTYNLISYGTLSGAIGDFTKGTIAGLGARQTSSLVTSGNNIALLIAGDSALWTGVASSNWTTTAVGTPFNWKTLAGAADTEFLASDDVVFDDTAAGSTSVNITDATVSPNSIIFNNSTKSYTISGGGIATGSITKSGSNTVSLTNTNTYTGATTINGGTLLVSGGSAIANTGLVTLGNVVGATFQVVGSETIGALSGGGATGGAVSIDASQTLTLSSGTQTYAGTVSGSGTLTSSGAVQTLNGALSHGTGVNVTSSVLTLGSASNSYTGSTVISSGAGLLVTANNALGAIGAGNGTTVTGSGGALISGALGFSGGINYSTAEKIIGSGVGNTTALGVFASVQRGFIQSVSGNNTFAGDIELNANGISRIGTQDGASLTLTGAITQGAGVTTASIFFRAGGSAGDFVTLSNAGNIFGGDSQIFTGLNTGSSYAGVRLGVTNALPTNRTISGGSATGSRTALDLAGYNQSLNGLNTGIGSLNIINTNTGTPSTLTLDPTVNKTSSNTAILGGGGLEVINVVKDGLLAQDLTVSSTYTGTTTITAGTLRLGDAAADTFATSSVTVASGGTLGGSGTLTGTLDISGNLAPGASGVDIKTLAAGSTTWNGGSNLWNFDLSASAGSSDLLAITGDFTKGTGSTYKFDFMGSAPASWGNAYTLATWTGTTSFLASDFSFQGLSGAYNGLDSYFTISGSSLTFTAVPEPTSALVGLLVGAGLLRRRRSA